MSIFKILFFTSIFFSTTLNAAPTQLVPRQSNDVDTIRNICQQVDYKLPASRSGSTEVDTESQFTTTALRQIAELFPTRFVVMYHDQDSKACVSPGTDHTHVHYELAIDTSLSRTQGYDILMMDQGTFDLAGDGGFNNWAYWGPDVVSQGKHLIVGGGQGC